MSHDNEDSEILDFDFIIVAQLKNMVRDLPDVKSPAKPLMVTLLSSMYKCAP